MSRILDGGLLAKVHAATENSYVPYSGFPVGTTLLLDDGTMITGRNVENASYGSTNCAERTAVSRVVTKHGDNHKAAVCAIIGRKTAPCHPCGTCRRVLHEPGCKRVIAESERPTDGGLGVPTSVDFEKILPYALGPEDL